MTNIKSHILRQNHKQSFPQKLLFYDAETKHQTIDSEEHHRLKIGTTAYVTMKRSFPWDNLDYRLWELTYPFNRYIESLVNQKEALYIFGHNLFFDLQASDFFYYFTVWGWELQFVYDQQLTYILVIRKDKRTIKAVSTTNYFDFSLEILGQTIGLEKQNVDLKTANREELIPYNKRDVEIIVKSIRQYIDFNKTHDTGKFGLTKASQAMNAFRHRFMNEKIYVHQVEEIKRLERAAYFGGRTEAFFFGQVPSDDIVFLDINSMYPFVMKDHPYPFKAISYQKEICESMFLQSLRFYDCVAEVSINTDTPLYPYRRDEKILFPTGRFKTTLTTPAIIEAIKRKHLKNIFRSAWYDRAYIFSDYVDYFYDLKLKYKDENNSVYLKLVKYFLNSLYGKFGQRKILTTEKVDLTLDGYYRMINYDFVTGANNIEYKLFNKIITEYGESDTSHTFTAIAAHVTSHARLLLNSIIEQIGRENIYYCDTDSIAVDRKVLSCLNYPLHPDTLGALSIDKECASLIINGNKNYVIDGKEVIKGIPKKSKRLRPYVYEYSSFLRQASHMKRQITRFYIIKKIIKESYPFYDKGKINKDGTISPLVLSEA